MEDLHLDKSLLPIRLRIGRSRVVPLQLSPPWTSKAASTLYSPGIKSRRDEVWGRLRISWLDFIKSHILSLNCVLTKGGSCFGQWYCIIDEL
jgi:hypothetical protein